MLKVDHVTKSRDSLSCGSEIHCWPKQEGLPRLGTTI